MQRILGSCILLFSAIGHMGSAWHTLVPFVQNVQAVQSLRSVQVVIGSRLVQKFQKGQEKGTG